MFAEKQKLVADLEIYGAGKQGPGGSEEAAAPPEGEQPVPPPATEEWGTPADRPNMITMFISKDLFLLFNA